jgi:hypothetical protein
MLMTSTTEKIQTLRCDHGEGHDWTRPSQRGKPPKYCPEHKATTAPQAAVKPAAKLDTKVAQANAEIAELDAEEARKRAEAVAKRKATIAAREAQEAAEKAEHDRQELASLTERIPATFAEWEKCFDKANKTNADEDWRHVTGLQNQVIGMKNRVRALEVAFAA